MMVLYESRSGDVAREIVVFSTVVNTQPQCFSSSNIVASAQHLEVFIHCFEPNITVVGDAKLAKAPLSGAYEYHARSTSRTILGCFGGVFQYFKRQDV